MQGSRTLFTVAMLTALAVTAQRAPALTQILDPLNRVVALDPTNSTSLVSIPLPTSIQMFGNGSFGSLPGENYNAGVIVYKDFTGALQYASVQNNGAPTVIAGNSYDHTLLSDNAGAIVGNTGSNTFIQRDPGSNVISSSTITADGSVNPGPVALSNTNAAFYPNTFSPGSYTVTVSGFATYDGVHPYGSVIIQYRDPTQGITYDSLD